MKNREFGISFRRGGEAYSTTERQPSWTLFREICRFVPKLPRRPKFNANRKKWRIEMKNRLYRGGEALLRPPGMIRIFTFLVLVAVLAVVPAGDALAQGGDEVTAAFQGILETVINIIQGLTVVVGILGLTLWGFGKVARPVFPEISNFTSQYIQGFVIGIVIVYVAATVVEALASSVSGSV